MQGRANLSYMRAAFAHAEHSPTSSHRETSNASSRPPTQSASSRRIIPSHVLVDSSQDPSTQQPNPSVATPPTSRFRALQPSGKPRTVIPLKRTLSSQNVNAALEGKMIIEKKRRKKSETPIQPPQPIRMEHAENGKWDKGQWVASPAQEEADTIVKHLSTPEVRNKHFDSVGHQNHQDIAAYEPIISREIRVPAPSRARLAHDRARFLANYTSVPQEQHRLRPGTPRQDLSIDPSNSRSGQIHASRPVPHSSQPLHVTHHDRDRDAFTTPTSHRSQPDARRTHQEPLFLSVSDEEEEAVENRAVSPYTRPQTRRGDIDDQRGNLVFHSILGGTPPEPPPAQKPTRIHSNLRGIPLNADPFAYMHRGKYAGNVTDLSNMNPRPQRYILSDTDDDDTPIVPRTSRARHQKFSEHEVGMRKVHTFSKRQPNIYAQPRNQAPPPLDDGVSYTYPRAQVSQRVATKSTESEYPRTEASPEIEHGLKYSDDESDDDPALFPSAQQNRSRSRTENSDYGGTQEAEWMRTKHDRSSPTPYTYMQPVSRGHQHIRHDENFPPHEPSYQFVGRGVRVAPRAWRRRQRAPRVIAEPRGSIPKLKLTGRPDAGEDIDEYIAAATRPVAEREARRAEATNGNLVHGEHPKKRRSGALVVLENIPEGMMKTIDTVKYDEARDLVKERCHREDMTINSGLVRAGEKSMRQAVLNQAARRRAPAGSRQTRAEVIRLDDPPSQDISQFTPSAEYRPPARTKPIHHRVGQLRFTARTPPPTPPRQAQMRTPALATVTVVDPRSHPIDPVTKSAPSLSQNFSTQDDNARPTNEVERLGPKLVKTRAERVKQQLLFRANEERQAQIAAVMHAVSNNDGEGYGDSNIERFNRRDLPVQEDEGRDLQKQTNPGYDEATTASQARRNEDIQDILDRMENNSHQGSQRENSLERDLSNITASQAQRFVDDELGVDNDFADNKILSKASGGVGANENDNSTPTRNARLKMSEHESSLNRQPIAGPSRSSIPDVPEPRDTPQHPHIAHKRPPLANIPLQGGMSGVDLTDYLVKMLQAPVPVQESTRQVKNRRRALRIEQKKKNDGSTMVSDAPPVNRWPLAASATQFSANNQGDKTSQASSPIKVTSSKHSGTSASYGFAPFRVDESTSGRDILQSKTSNKLSVSRSPSKTSSAAVSEAAQESSDNDLEPPSGQLSRKLSPTQMNTPDPPLQDGIRPFWSRKAIAPQISTKTPKSPGWKDVDQSRHILSQPFRNPTRGNIPVSQDIKQYATAQTVQAGPSHRFSQPSQVAGPSRTKLVPAIVAPSQDGSILYDEAENDGADGIFTGYNVSQGGPFELPRPVLTRSQSFKPPLRNPIVAC